MIFSWILSFKNLFSDRPECHALLSRVRIYSSYLFIIFAQRHQSVSSISVLPEPFSSHSYSDKGVRFARSLPHTVFSLLFCNICKLFLSHHLSNRHSLLGLSWQNKIAHPKPNKLEKLWPNSGELPLFLFFLLFFEEQ